MPFINVKTNTSITPEGEQSIKTALGNAISLIREKSESWLMVNLEGDSHLYFRGDGKTPCAIAEVKLYGSASSSEFESLTGRITDILSSELGIEPGRIYVKYEETRYWGYGGHNF